jgi:hypothetical protein
VPKAQTRVPEEATVGRDGKRVCGAVTRSGGRCQDTAVMPNGRCRRHKGTASKGVLNPLIKTGRYSLDLPTRVLGRYEAALADPELLSVRDDIALLQGAVTDLMAELKEAENRPDLDQILGTVEKMAAEWQGWDWTKMNAELQRLKEMIVGRQSQRQAMREIRELIREKAALVAQENRLLADRQQLITVEQYLLGMRALGSAVRRLIDDPVTLRSIDTEFRRLASVPDRTKPGA